MDLQREFPEMMLAPIWAMSTPGSRRTIQAWARRPARTSGARPTSPMSGSVERRRIRAWPPHVVNR